MRQGAVKLKSAVHHVDQGNSMPPEEVALFFIMASMGLSVYGALTSFVPSTFWLRWGTYLSVTATLLLTTYLYWGFGTGRMKTQEGASKLKKVLALSFLPIVIFGAIWMVTVHALADFYTLAFGSQNSESVLLVKERGGGRYTCQYRLKGQSLESAIPNHICISDSAYEALPSYPTTFLLDGKISILGFHIGDVYRSLKSAGN